MTVVVVMVVMVVMVVIVVMVVMVVSALCLKHRWWNHLLPRVWALIRVAQEGGAHGE